VRRSLVVLSALLLVACASGSAPATSGPCCPCQASAAAGLQNVALPQSPKVRELGLKRVDLARKRLVLLRVSFDRGATTIDEVFAACRDVAFAARDSGLRGGALRDLTRERAAKGAVGEDAVSRVEAIVAEAEFWLEEANERL
jgi:hypothetical protein